MSNRRPNYLGIIAGTIVFYAFGAIWFSSLGSAWLAASGETAAQVAVYGFWPFVVALIAALLVSYCFDNMLWHYEEGTAMKGLQIGILTGVCIYLAMLLNLYSFEGRSLALIAIDGGYGLIGFALTGLTVGAVRGRMKRTTTGSVS